MKFKLCVLTLGCSLHCELTLCHEVVVHERITVNAAASALSYSSGYKSFLDTVNSECSIVSAVDAMRIGSAREDDVPKQDLVGGYRSYNHFYDPLTELGLSNIPPDDRISPLGNDSFTWAWKFNSPGLAFLGFPWYFGKNVGTLNRWSWQNA